MTRPPRVIELDDGSVIIPAALTLPLRQWLLRQLVVRRSGNGGQPSAVVRELLYGLDRAWTRHQGQQASTDTGTLHNGPASLEAEEMSVEDAATDMGCTPGWVRKLYRLGRLRGRRAGQRTLLLQRTSVDAYRHRERAP